MKKVLLAIILLFLSGLIHAQQMWERNYGGPGADFGHSVQQTLDGGYIVVGKTNSFGGGDQVYLIKTNASGDTLWTRTCGGMVGESVQQTQDGGYIIVGTTAPFPYGQAYLIKTDNSGDSLWSRTYGDYRTGNFVQQTQDGGYIIVAFKGGVKGVGPTSSGPMPRVTQSGPESSQILIRSMHGVTASVRLLMGAL